MTSSGIRSLHMVSDKCTPCEPGHTYQVLYGQKECKDCPIDEEDLKNTAFKDACEGEEETSESLYF